MCWNGKNPQKALQHHSRRKLQFSYRPTNKHREENQKCIYTVQKLEGLKNIETFNLQPATDDVSDL